MADDLELIERLHALKVKGLLTEQEFALEKARVLAKKHTSVSVEQEPSSVEQPSIRTGRGFRYKASNTARLASVTLLALLAGGTYWLVVADPFEAFEQSSEEVMAQNSQIADSPPKLTSDGPNDKSDAESEQVTALDSMAVPEAEPVYPEAKWFIKDSDEGFIAMYGPPQASWNYALECDPINRTIEFMSWGADASSGDRVVADVAGDSLFKASVRFVTDDPGTGRVTIPSTSKLFSALIAGETPLRITWNLGAVDEMPNAPELRGFLTTCRQRAVG